MNKKILILNGAARQKGKTFELIEAFTKGAEDSGNEVILFNLSNMDISGCIGCLKAKNNSNSPCIQKDDMDKIYKEFDSSDVIVFASPVYFWTITGPLKNTVDRLYAKLETLGYNRFAKESVLLMTSDGNDYSQALNWYRKYESNLGWKNRGEVLGKNKIDQAYNLGLTI